MNIFSEIQQERIIYKGINFFLIKDSYPVSRGHILIISNEEKLDYFQLNKKERLELTELIHKAKELIEKEYKPDINNIIDHYNSSRIGINAGNHINYAKISVKCITVLPNITSWKISTIPSC